MRHRNSFNQLGRKRGHRKAMLQNMASSLIMHKRINTTVAKAKALRSVVEPLITRAKEDTTANRRVVFRALQDKDAVSELFRNISVKVGDRPGGYTRILRTEIRLGDNAEMCIIELVDYNENMLSEDKGTTQKKRVRRSRSTSAKAKSEVVENVATEKSDPQVKEENSDNDSKK
jgi:large subunit ribosomal protein L17